ncbi:hypothetical protein V5P93_003752 [Actinokineospora auranticolor]|uniref:Uncharacterized protein n=1 Tax=Actinokineospora auranticolor TaxID=155976 RepID=A0A2S6GLC5_9PSEU|nr:hypothetical protein [Actinokineospora auranticolor]PPK66038.1 hypothetical protein CLV40_1112 [Actinokineospora auranticolor]
MPGWALDPIEVTVSGEGRLGPGGTVPDLFIADGSPNGSQALEKVS